MKLMKKKYQTLHWHTTTSDGKLDYVQTLDACAKYGIGVVAYTDHDAVPGKEDIKLLREHAGHQTKWISGIEISAGLPKEVGGGPGGARWHIVGLFVDPTYKPLIEYCEKKQEARIARANSIVKNLSRLGFKITLNDCLEVSKGESLGRPHIVQILEGREENMQLMMKFFERLKANAKSDERARKALKQIEVQGKQQIPYALFLTSDSYISGVYTPVKFYLDSEQTVKLIRDAGGLAIIAHYYFGMDRVPPNILEKLFKENRLDGGEVVYGLFTEEFEPANSDFDRELRQSEELVSKLCRKYDKVESGGVDAHSENDLRVFANTPEYAKRTVGMVEKAIEKTGVDTEWSSL